MVLGERCQEHRPTKNITQEDFEESTKGIVCDTHPSVKDEAPQAYKDLSDAMKNQPSLTDTVYRLLPLVNLEGIEASNSKKYRSKKAQLEATKKNRDKLVKGIEKIKNKLSVQFLMSQRKGWKLPKPN